MGVDGIESTQQVQGREAEIHKCHALVVSGLVRLGQEFQVTCEEFDVLCTFYLSRH